MSKSYELQTHYVNTFVTRALQNSLDFSASGDRYTKLLGKIQDTPYTVVELSTEETKTLLEALLMEMNTYTSVTAKKYYLKESAK